MALAFRPDDDVEIDAAKFSKITNGQLREKRSAFGSNRFTQAKGSTRLGDGFLRDR